MNPAANHCPLPKSALWRFLSLLFTETPLPPPLFPATPFSPPSGPATGSFNGLHRESNFLAMNS